MPNSTFIKVLLPEPFSPSSPTIWPARTSRSTPSLARNAPKQRTMPRISRRLVMPSRDAPVGRHCDASLPLVVRWPQGRIGDRRASGSVAADAPIMLVARHRVDRASHRAPSIPHPHCFAMTPSPQGTSAPSTTRRARPRASARPSSRRKRISSPCPAARSTTAAGTIGLNGLPSSYISVPPVTGGVS